MANKEENEERPPRGNEWEVVSLTSSAYAAAPGPYNVESTRDALKYDAYYGAETSPDVFMSDHFVFPPREHENLPLDEPSLEEEQGRDGKDLMLEDQVVSDKLRNTRFLNEQSVYGESPLGSSRHMDSLGSESAMYEHGLIDAEPNEYAERDLDPRSLDTATNPLRLVKDAKKSTHDLPCEAWWRRRAISMYLSTREANAIWSLFFAAAVTGLVVLGQHWQQERWQVLQLKWQSSISSEKLSRVLEPLWRLKDMIVRGKPQASLIRSGSSSEI